jgi:ADP-heptose:LPS heptosyltransferase
MKVLVVRNDKIGDLVLALPAMEALKKAGHQVGVWASPYAAPLIEKDARVDRVLGAEQLAGGGFDAALVLLGNWKNAWLVFRSGIKERLGASGRPYAALYTRRLGIRRSLAEKSEAEYNLDFVRALGMEVPDGLAPRLDLPQEDHAAAAAWLAKAGLERPVMLHPGSRGSAQNWEPGRYAELGRQLRQRYGAELLVTAGPGEAEMASALGAELGCQALADLLPLRVFAALTARAALFVSASTGPMHLAAAGGAPTLSLFPPIRAMSPRRWGPQGNRHAVLSPAGLGLNLPARPGLNYVSRISVAEAMAAAAFALGDAHA